jgi:hypothetical protein
MITEYSPFVDPNLRPTGHTDHPCDTLGRNISPESKFTGKWQKKAPKCNRALTLVVENVIVIKGKEVCGTFRC